MTSCSTTSRRPKCAATRRRARRGPSADAARREGLRHLGLKNHATFSGALAWPYLYPWPQRPPGLVEAGVRRTRQDAGSRSSTCSTTTASELLLRDASRRRHVRRRDLRDVSRARRAITRPATSCSTPATSCCSSSTISRTSTSTTIASRCSTSRTRSSVRRARQGVYSGYAALDGPRRTLPFAGRRPGGFQRHLLQVRAYDFEGWAVLEWECALKHPEDGAREGAEFIKNTSSA